MKYINVLFNALTPYDLYSDLNMYCGCNKVNFQAYFTFLILLCDKKILYILIYYVKFSSYNDNPEC